uniref:Gastrula zinc finger protein XlCGF46.1-like n=1 Tax=Diabrotica virgifera virgifera TaxID=50390 RepID=A0A6P7H1H8_DIAVI
MITNNSSRPFVCSVCMKGFKRVGYLHSHFITHSTEKKVICEECGKGFYRKDQLKKHARFHKTRQKKEQTNITEHILPKEHLLDNNTKTAHVTISVEKERNTHFEIPIQIPIQKQPYQE